MKTNTSKENQMEWKQKGFNNNKVWEPQKEGDFLEGSYQGFRVIVSKKNPKWAPLQKHTLKDENNSMIDFWGCGLLNYLLKDMALDSNIRVEYKGRAKVKGFKEELVQYNVFTR